MSLVRFATTILAGLMAAGCAEGPVRPKVPVPASSPPCTHLLWSADHETGDLSQWYAHDGGGVFNSGAAISVASTDVARTGRHSLRTTISTPSMPEVSGVRLFRWEESRAHVEACYSAWLYIPRHYEASGWWNVFQFKSRNESGANDSFWQLQIGNRSQYPYHTLWMNPSPIHPDRHRAMYLYLTWWGPPVEGPRQGEWGSRHFSQPIKNIVPRRWMHLEVYLRQSSGFDGQITVWQDGVELFNLSNVRTRYPDANGANEWSLNNYSEGVSPSPTTIYYDDAMIHGTATAAEITPDSHGGGQGEESIVTR